MNQVEVTGKTVDEAVEKGLSELGIQKKFAEIEVIDEASNGIFGIIGARPAKVIIKKKYDPATLGRDYLEGLLDKMRIPATVEIKEQTEREIHLDVQGKNLGMIIGKRGQTLEALQFLVNLYLNQKLDGSNIYTILDAENYREKRKQTLERLAENLAKKAKRTNRKVVLEPMSRYERKIIHTKLQDENGVKTYSEGIEPNRKVIISVDD